MLRGMVLLAVLVAAGCGGGGGGATPAPLSAPTRLEAGDLDLAPTASTTELVVRLAATDNPAPVLLEVAVELPAALSVVPNNRLAKLGTFETLDGDYKAGRFVVLCGDAQNAQATPLQPGPLFGLRLVATNPRTPGTYTIMLHDLRAATNDGTATAVDTKPTAVVVTVR